VRVALIDGHEPKLGDLDSLIDGHFFQATRAMTTMLALGPMLVDFDRHMERLAAHAEELGIKEVPKPNLMRFEIDSLLARLTGSDQARVRIILFSAHDGSTRRIIEASALIREQSNAEGLSSGLRLSTVVDKAWPRGSHIKTGVLGKRGILIERACSAGFDDVLWVNSDGEISESTWANIFLIGRTGDLVEVATPPPASGILLGVTRQRIMELLTISKIPVTERVITLDELPRFDEGFVTSSIRGIRPLVQIDRHKLQSVRPNAVVNHIARLYRTWLKIGSSNDFIGLGQKPHS